MIQYRDDFDSEWIDKILEVHNRTEMKRSPEKKQNILSAFEKSSLVISAWQDSRLVGIGRVVSDGQMYTSIFDVVVDPEFQKKGVGREIMERMTRKYSHTCIYLTSTFGNEEFYRKLGFLKHKTGYALYPGKMASSEYLEQKKPTARAVATDFTMGFLKEHLSPATRLLEVGCGLGDLALTLSENGFDVHAIDPSEKAVKSAREKNIRATQSNIENFHEAGFDAILFTRSLHHIHPIGTCLDAAISKLNSGGRLILEDFGFELVDENTAVWFQSLKNIFSENLGKADWKCAVEKAYVQWRQDHTEAHALHTSVQLISEIEKRFKHVQVIHQVPYLFRYFIGPEGMTSEIIRSIMKAEEDLIRHGTIKGIGFRIVAHERIQ